MSGRGGVPATDGRTKKGRNFCPEEEEQCCRSFMHTSTDARRGIGQKNAQFWITISIVAYDFLVHVAAPSKNTGRYFT
jgi:hypothetical protein